MTYITSITYDEIANLTEQLSYRDKLRLAQLLIQFARKEEEEQNPEHRAAHSDSSSPNQEIIQYAAARLLKLRPCMIKFKINIGQRDQVSFNSLLGGRPDLRTGC